jgi:ribosomal protein S18 acetylase RimI-like enzyme
MVRSDVFQVEEKPQVQGLVFRKFRGGSDIEQMWQVRKEVAKWDKVDPQSSRESLPTEEEFVKEWAGAEIGNPECVIVEKDNQIIGYSRILWWTEKDDKRVYLHLGWLLPEWRNQGIGTAMLHLCQSLIGEMVAKDGITSKVELATNASSTEQDAVRLMEAEGYKIVNTLSDMVLSDLAALVPANFPPGIEVRPVTPEHFRAIFEVYADAYSTYERAQKADEQAFQNFVTYELAGDTALYRVAWWGEQAVGIVLCHLRNGVGTVDQVEVRKAFQRRGIARALLTEALQELAARGIQTARLYTAANNREGARSLYESLGFREVKQHYLYRKALN